MNIAQATVVAKGVRKGTQIVYTYNTRQQTLITVLEVVDGVISYRTNTCQPTAVNKMPVALLANELFEGKSKITKF